MRARINNSMKRTLARAASAAYATCYMYRGFLALVSLFWLSSCAVANNQIGFELSFDKPLSSECVERIFPQVRGISEIVTTSSGYNGFSLGGYEVGLFFTKIDSLTSGYKIKIDGMFQLESYDSFTQKASKLNNDIRVHFEEGCAD
mgnify:CR=1 FL=1